ncbi:MAG: SLC13 family permease [Hyphomicrobiales bacterium]
MTYEQTAIIAILVGTMGMFLWGRWRHDMVALAALLAGVAAGVVPADEAFAGFGHPAVITVAAVLILSRALLNTGAVDAAADRFMPTRAGATVTIAALVGFVAALSAFMNNVGAFALVMPIALKTASRLEIAPSRMLMPIAFGSILGGMTTLIGTPPNLIVSAFRAKVAGDSGFAMFDFTPVGLAVALAGIAFVSLVGRALVPARQGAATGDFDIGAYLTEVRVPDDSRIVDMALREIEAAPVDADFQIVGLVRNGVRLRTPSPVRKVRADDILVVEAAPDSLTTILSTFGLTLAEAKATPSKATEKEAEAKRAAPEGAAKAEAKPSAPAPNLELAELVVIPGTALSGLSATDISLRRRFGINLLAVSRQGTRSLSRLRSIRLQDGDVLLVQGVAEDIASFASTYGLVPLAERTLRLPDTRKMLTAVAIMVAAVIASASGFVPAAVAFAAAVLAVMATQVLPLRSIYTAIDWPVIVLLGALIPVAGAMATTGTAELIAGTLLDTVAKGHPVVALALVLVVTMTLSDFVNNAATAAVMCPIAIGTANGVGASPDAFLMAVAIGASCAFLTPIGHQNNTLILGPGGLKFGDYWRLGLPLELLVIAVSVPLLLVVWPL